MPRTARAPLQSTPTGRAWPGRAPRRTAARRGPAYTAASLSLPAAPGRCDHGSPPAQRPPAARAHDPRRRASSDRRPRGVESSQPFGNGDRDRGLEDLVLGNAGPLQLVDIAVRDGVGAVSDLVEI